MVPDTRARLETATSDLKRALVRRRERRKGEEGVDRIDRVPQILLFSHHQDDLAADAADTPELTAARDAVTKAEAALA